jgi:hypothetical protein
VAQCWCDRRWQERLQSENLSCTILATLHDNTEDLRREVGAFLRVRNGSGGADGYSICSSKGWLDSRVQKREQQTLVGRTIQVDPAAREELTKFVASSAYSPMRTGRQSTPCSRAARAM